MTIETRLVAGSAERFTEGLPLTIEVTNRGEQEVLVLTWLTPLEGLLSDCLLVLRDGVEVAYDGMLVKRREPGPEDFLRLPAGETVTRSFDLSAGYRVEGPSTYSVELRPWRAPILAAGAEPTLDPDLLIAPPVPGLPLELEVEQDRAVAPTLGERARAGERRRGAPGAGRRADRIAGAPKEPVLVGGTATQQAETQRAHSDGYGLAAAALAGLVNDAKYVEWFGAYTTTRLTAVETVYTKIKAGMEARTLTYDLTGTGCQSSWYAYTYKGASTVWMCNGFWRAPATGTDSKAGTVVHEWSHALANTDDLAYGQASCRELARDEPDKAVRNADSFEYYAGG